MFGYEEDWRTVMSQATVDEEPKQHEDRMHALAKVDPTKPQEVAKYFKKYGSRFGSSGFRETKAWRDAIERVAAGGPTLEKNESGNSRFQKGGH